ncbi:hypothetical protein [Pseudomonas sp. MWU12-2323]|uniref:hypothetical protein n=1 Tax=Pseudomonas sp. MWU12-2323 TaxID=2651296 RepID=UPI00128C9C0B|nr:hypothetical protein [Pseudomonas sp. MWU12-2323]MPQ69472.1 hypothetical protein [Pseudomonas sp. MWU12-2323]
MINDRNGIINQILDGTNTDREHAERIYEVLRTDNRIYFDETVGLDRQGLVIRADVDLLAVAAEIE